MKKYVSVMLGISLGCGVFFHSIFGHSMIAEVHSTQFHALLKPFYHVVGYRELKVYVMDAQTESPIENALVMIGEQDESPTEKNWILTNKNGEAIFDGFLLPQGPLTVTVAHEAYSRYSIFETTADEFHIPLLKLEDSSSKTELSGSFTHWPPMEDYDGIMEVGLFLPFTDMLSLLSFSTDRLLAPYVKAYIYKEVQVPGNLVIPDQEENIMGFVPVYVSKPTYQMPFPTSTTQNFITLAGEIPFGKFASGVINKQPLPTLLNMISLNQMGMVQQYAIPEAPTTLDIALQYVLKPKFNIQVLNAPQQKDIIYLSCGTFKNDLNTFFPMDFKLNSRNDKSKNALLKTVAAEGLLPAIQELVFVLATDLPQNTSDPRKLDSSILGVAKRPTADAPIYVQSFLNSRDLSYQESSRTFKIQERKGQDAPPADHMQISFLNLHTPKTDTQKSRSRVWWTIVTPSSMKEFHLPTLPHEFSKFPNLAPTEELEWISSTFGFNEKNYEFDYNQFDPSTFTLSLTHLSQNHIKLIPAQIE